MNESLWVAAKRTFTIPCPWALNPQVVNELLGWQPKERSPSLAPWPFNPQVVNELLWVAAKRTFTISGPWPLVRLVSRVSCERVAVPSVLERAL